MYVAKFAWAPAKRMLEIDLLKHAKDNEVQGVVKVVAYREITSIRDRDLREGLESPKRYRFRDTMADKDSHRNSSIKNTSGHKQVLRRKAHTYHHDLELFFYVLLWMCARTPWTKAEFKGGKNDLSVKASKLEKWVNGNFEDITDNKHYHMGFDGFQDILYEFPKAFKIVGPPCDSIKLPLFPLDERSKMFLGTSTKPPYKLYSSILAEFNETSKKAELTHRYDESAAAFVPSARFCVFLSIMTALTDCDEVQDNLNLSDD
ncbi:hypothetical protein F4859DRAFT_524555 [Xylaria cf. heliscus]|nr:hypothetical protein F4859DRAFT_524555 [Xylaria cf. heliscus]